MSIGRNGHQITVLGNLGRDPEMRYTPGGDAVTNFSVATNRRWPNPNYDSSTPEGDGNRKNNEETTWWRITTWKGLAESCNQWLSKGRMVLVEGRMIIDPVTGGPKLWTGREGDTRTSFEINAENVRFLGSNGNGSGGSTGPTPPGTTEDDEEIPF